MDESGQGTALKLFNCIQRPASYADVPSSEVMHPTHQFCGVEFGEEVNSLLHLRAERIFNICGSSFNDVCFAWLACCEVLPELMHSRTAS